MVAEIWASVISSFVDQLVALNKVNKTTTKGCSDVMMTTKMCER